MTTTIPPGTAVTVRTLNGVEHGVLRSATRPGYGLRHATVAMADGTLYRCPLSDVTPAHWPTVGFSEDYVTAEEVSW